MGIVFSIAVRYLFGRVRQSLLTVGGIVIGVLALTVIQAMMGGFRANFVDSMLGASPHITVRRKSIQAFDPASPTRDALRRLQDPFIVQLSRPPLPDEEEEIRSPSTVEEAIRQVPGVTVTAPMVGGQVLFGFSGNWEPVSLNGILPSRQARLLDFASKVIEGNPEDLERNQSGVILGRILAERMRVGVGDRVTARAEDGALTSLRIVGLYASGIYDVDNSTAYVNLRRGQSLLGLGSTVNTIGVRTTDYEAADETARRIEYAIGMEAESWMEASANNLGLLRMITTVMYLVTFFTMTVAGFGIAGNLVTTVSEKTFDIGVLKAMGMKSREISLVFLTLALLMVIIGLGLGLVLSYFAVEGISRIPSASREVPGAIVSSSTFPMMKSTSMYVISAGFALVIGMAAGFSPAVRAARLEPLNIIRNAAG